jgi:hypothetical protein
MPCLFGMPQLGAYQTFLTAKLSYYRRISLYFV